MSASVFRHRSEKERLIAMREALNRTSALPEDYMRGAVLSVIARELPETLPTWKRISRR
jgi:hypothetical protein